MPNWEWQVGASAARGVELAKDSVPAPHNRLAETGYSTVMAAWWVLVLAGWHGSRVQVRRFLLFLMHPGLQDHGGDQQGSDGAKDAERDQGDHEDWHKAPLRNLFWLPATAQAVIAVTYGCDSSGLDMRAMHWRDPSTSLRLPALPPQETPQAASLRKNPLGQGVMVVTAPSAQES